jgi:carboxyl-terminal processing protease
MKKYSSRRIIITTVGLVIVLVLIFLTGVYLGFNNRPAVTLVTSLFNKEVPTDISISFEPFWRAWHILETEYAGGEIPSVEDRMWGAISGMTKSYNDPYTVFLKPEQSRAYTESLEGNFEGVGMEIGMKDEILTVISPIKDTPAEKAGILAGDRVLEIDGESTLGLTLEEAVIKIRGEKGTTVVLSIAREGVGELFDVNVVRDTILVPIIDTEIINNEVFRINFHSFSATSADQFRDTLREFRRFGGNKLIVDLRGNLGGFLESSIDVASWFLPKGEIVVTSKGDGQAEVFRSKGYNIFDDNLRFVILVNKGSASASEIFAGAMQDHGKAILVGEETFGKGSVQQRFLVTPDSDLKITIAKWHTPNGRSISDEGLVPDYVVEMVNDDLEKNDDPILDMALEILED